MTLTPEERTMEQELESLRKWALEGGQAVIITNELALRLADEWMQERERASRYRDALAELVDAALFERDDLGDIFDRASSLLAVESGQI